MHLLYAYVRYFFVSDLVVPCAPISSAMRSLSLFLHVIVIILVCLNLYIKYITYLESKFYQKELCLCSKTKTRHSIALKYMYMCVSVFCIYYMDMWKINKRSDDPTHIFNLNVTIFGRYVELKFCMQTSI